MGVSPRTEEVKHTDRRFGRLAATDPRPEAAQVRCSCDNCGAHLIAAPDVRGVLEGACPVCLSQAFTPLDRR